MKELLKSIRDAGVAVVGDFCIDAYWMIDTSLSEPSLETGRPTLPVTEGRYSLGGAGNIAANLAALGVKAVHAVSVAGDDPFGREMRRLLEALGVNADGLIVQDENWATPVYGKPFINDEEQPRLDMGAANRLHPESERRLLGELEKVLPRVRAVVVNQQLRKGIHSDAVIRGINGMAARSRDPIFIVDSRDCSERFENAVFRFNAHEAARFFGRDVRPGEDLQVDQPVFISRGASGALVCSGGRVEEIEAIQCDGETDPVGAGDTSVSALAAALAAGAAPREAAILANLASAVTVRKLKCTGTATPEEILELAGRKK